MKINELNGQDAKISKNSITVKDPEGKTIGVIARCYELSNRDSSMVWTKIRKAVGLEAAWCLKQMRKIDNNIVFLNNIKSKKSCNNAESLAAAGITVVNYRGV